MMTVSELEWVENGEQVEADALAGRYVIFEINGFYHVTWCFGNAIRRVAVCEGGASIADAKKTARADLIHIVLESVDNVELMEDL